VTQETLTTVEAQLRAALEQTGLSHHELARRSGVSQPILSRFLKGERTLTLPIVNKLCEMLGLVLCPEAASKPAPDLKAQARSKKGKDRLQTDIPPPQSKPKTRTTRRPKGS
jgi:transcriptional regulator with XRE-family HTH domain